MGEHRLWLEKEAGRKLGRTLEIVTGTMDFVWGALRLRKTGGCHMTLMKFHRAAA